jgi:hypothetical protein
VTDQNITFKTFKEIVLPATTVFGDQGVFHGKKEDSSTWVFDGSIQNGAIVSAGPIVLTKVNHCADVKVRMLVRSESDAKFRAASDSHYFSVDDVVDYPIPAKKPPIEFGKLVDDMSVTAVLLTDAGAPMVMERESTDDAAAHAKCLAGAKDLAAHVHGGIGEQTTMVVPIRTAAIKDANYGCSLGPQSGPDLFVSWENQAKPTAAAADFIADAGEFLTGSPGAELRQELSACATEALKPDAGEMGSREFRGVKIECQAFARDGGGGSATIYRRFGAYPARQVTEQDRLAFAKATEIIKGEDAKSATDSLAFANWWLDPAIPTKVKTFAMISARIISLAERCPTWKPNYAKVAEAAAFAGVDKSDIAPGGKYFTLVFHVMTEMRAGAAQEKVETACEEAKKYDP